MGHYLSLQFKTEGKANNTINVLGGFVHTHLPHCLFCITLCCASSRIWLRPDLPAETSAIWTTASVPEASSMTTLLQQRQQQHQEQQPQTVMATSFIARAARQQGPAAATSLIPRTRNAAGKRQQQEQARRCWTHPSPTALKVTSAAPSRESGSNVSTGTPAAVAAVDSTMAPGRMWYASRLEGPEGLRVHNNRWTGFVGVTEVGVERNVTQGSRGTCRGWERRRFERQDERGVRVRSKASGEVASCDTHRKKIRVAASSPFPRSDRKREREGGLHTRHATAVPVPPHTTMRPTSTLRRCCGCRMARGVGAGLRGRR
eukprot:363878-Chlamydomonas_euryale.AAC.7